MQFSDKISLLALIVSVLGGIFNFFYNRSIQQKQTAMGLEQNKAEIQLQEKNNRLEASMTFEKVRYKKEAFEEILADLVSMTEESDKQLVQSTFLKCYNKYTALYNEIEDLCTKILDKVIISEDYIKKIILVELYKLAQFQYEYYKALDDFAINLNLKRINKPDYKAFENYDRFLKTYYNENSYQWREIEKGRKNSGFSY